MCEVETVVGYHCKLWDSKQIQARSYVVISTGVRKDDGSAAGSWSHARQKLVGDGRGLRTTSNFNFNISCFKTQHKNCVTVCNFIQDSEGDEGAPALEQRVEGETEMPQQEKEEGISKEAESDSSRSSSPVGGRVSHCASTGHLMVSSPLCKTNCDLCVNLKSCIIMLLLSSLQ